MVSRLPETPSVDATDAEDEERLSDVIFSVVLPDASQIGCHEPCLGSTDNVRVLLNAQAGLDVSFYDDTITHDCSLVGMDLGVDILYVFMAFVNENALLPGRFR